MMFDIHNGELYQTCCGSLMQTARSLQYEIKGRVTSFSTGEEAMHRTGLKVSWSLTLKCLDIQNIPKDRTSLENWDIQKARN